MKNTVSAPTPKVAALKYSARSTWWVPKKLNQPAKAVEISASRLNRAAASTGVSP